MIIKSSDYEKIIDKNRLEDILLSNGFLHKKGSYMTFKKRIEGKTYSVDLGNEYIDFYVGNKKIESIEYISKPDEFWHQLEFLNFI